MFRNLRGPKQRGAEGRIAVVGNDGKPLTEEQKKELRRKNGLDLAQDGQTELLPEVQFGVQQSTIDGKRRRG